MTGLRVPGMIIIGSAGRNSGKTDLACALISELKQSAPVIGLKVSTIYGDGRVCLRGNTGCGVCVSLEGDFCITEEDSPTRQKDTGRMLAAGADRVYWLQVREGHLSEGLDAFLALRRADEAVVCESNGLRTVCEPDLFLMMRSATGTDLKSSAEAVIHLADRVVNYDGEQFDFNINGVRRIDGIFLWTDDAAAVLLAGGESSRMGADKRFLEIEGEQLIARGYRRLAAMFDNVMVSVGRGGSNSPALAPNLKVVTDGVDGAGPVGGIIAALESSDKEINLVVACDIPDIPAALVRALLIEARRHDIAVPRYSNGSIEPLLAAYRTSTLPVFRAMLARAERQPRVAFGAVDTCYVDMNPSWRLTNLNTPADYGEFVGEGRVEVSSA